MKSKVLRLIGGEPVVLTWTMFLWGWFVPLVLLVAAVVGQGIWAAEQAERLNYQTAVLTRQTLRLNDLRKQNATLNRRTDRLLCSNTNKERDILIDLINALYEGARPETRRAFDEALKRLQPADCTKLPSRRTR